MKNVLKLFLSIILVLLIAIGLTWYIKIKKPEVVELPERGVTPSFNPEFFKSLPIETIKPQTSPKPPVTSSPTFQQNTTQTTTTEEFFENLEIIITVKELKFIPAEITTQATIPLLIVFKNEDSVPLDLKISNENWSVKSDLVAPGSSIKMEIKFPSPGIYEFYSTVPIAQEKNMKGRIIVK